MLLYSIMKPEIGQIIDACLKKDERAYKRLYDLYAAKMYGVCLRYTSTSGAAEDVMHEGFIRVFENLHKLRDVSSLEAWMRKTMIYTALNFNRQELPLATTGRIDDCSDSDYTSGDEIISRLDAEIVLNAIQKLPDSYRMAINLCEIEGYTFEEAAKMMNVKEASVRSALVRGKKALATIFKERY